MNNEHLQQPTNTVSIDTKCNEHYEPYAHTFTVQVNLLLLVTHIFHISNTSRLQAYHHEITNDMWTSIIRLHCTKILHRIKSSNAASHFHIYFYIIT